jgi:hypothetical protein
MASTLFSNGTISRFMRRMCLLAGLVCGGVAPAAAAPALFAPLAPGAATAADAAAAAAQPQDRTVVRWRPVRLNAELLGAAGAQPIALNLFDDLGFIADPERVERGARGTTWIGRLRGLDDSQVVIVVNGAVAAGNITLPSGRYHIRFAGDGVHQVQVIDDSRFPQEDPTPPEPPLPAAGAAAAPDPIGAAADDGSTIDVMIVYTATTRAAAGGAAAIQALMDLAVAETNQSYQNSGVTQRLRLVHTEEVNYNEAGHADPLRDALNCITSTGDGCLDHVHGLRNTHGADLVSFWLEGGGSYCGIAWMMTDVSVSFATHGFSTVARSCATGYYSFGHELGHNMGVRHDTYVDTAGTPYPYAHGYAYPAGRWRTIMAYNNACSAAGVNCTRLQYWANPEVQYGGAAMGNAGTADDHRALNDTAPTVANFRASVSAPVCNYALGGVGQSIGAGAGSGSVAVSVADGCPWSAVSDSPWLTLDSGASGSGNGSVAWSAAPNGGAAARSGTLTIAGQTYTVTQGFEDGFPSGGALPPNWVQPAGSNAPWNVSAGTAYGGSFSLRSGVIGNVQSSALQVGGRYRAGTVSFVLKVDSEANGDYLNFFIDGVLRGAWTGSVPWTPVSFPVSAGMHSFKWVYVKNGSGAAGADAAWIDNVALPPPDRNAALGTLLMLLLE